MPRVHRRVLAGAGLLAFDPRVDGDDLAGGWPEVLVAVRQEVATASASSSGFGDVVVVGPHWVICAQLEAQLGDDPPGSVADIARERRLRRLVAARSMAASRHRLVGD